MQALVAGGHRAGGKRLCAAIRAGDEATGLAHQDDAGRDVPGLQVTLPVKVRATAGDVGEIESSRAEAAGAAGHRHHGRDLAQELRVVAASEIRRTIGHEGVGHVRPAGDAQAAVVEIGALPAFGHEQLVLGRIVDDAGDDLALAFETHRDREMGDAVEEVGGAIERVDMPGVALVLPFDVSRFLENQAIAGTRLHQGIAQHLFSLAVGGGDEVAGALARNLEVLDLAIVALEAAGGLADGVDHDGHEG